MTPLAAHLLLACAATGSSAAGVPCGQQDLTREPLEFVVRGDNWMKVAATRVLPGVNRRVVLGQPAATKELLHFGPLTRMRISSSGRLTAKTARSITPKLRRIIQEKEQMVTSWPQLVRDISKVPEGVTATFVLPSGELEVTNSGGHLQLGRSADILSPEVIIRGNGARLRVKDGDPLVRMYGAALLHFEGPMTIERDG